MTIRTLHRGQLAHHPKIASVRVLSREDMLRLKAPRPIQNRPKLMRESHHRLARLVAAGLRSNEILARTGYSTARFSTLTRDPAFQELVTKYREKVDEAFINGIDEFYETSTSNMLRGERKIEEILDADDEGTLEKPLTLNQLMALTSDRADRFGYGKKTTQKNEVYDFAAMMEAAIKRSGRSNVIDGKKEYDTNIPKTKSPALARLVPDADDGGTDG